MPKISIGQPKACHPVAAEWFQGCPNATPSQYGQIKNVAPMQTASQKNEVLLLKNAQNVICGFIKAMGMKPVSKPINAMPSGWPTHIKNKGNGVNNAKRIEPYRPPLRQVPSEIAVNVKPPSSAKEVRQFIQVTNPMKYFVYGKKGL